ncbi:MAG: hypothetical protein ABGY32_01410 [bacterium]
MERELLEREGVERELLEREGVERELLDREGVERELLEREGLERWERLELWVRLPWELLRLRWAKASAEGRASRRIRVVVIRRGVLMGARVGFRVRPLPSKEGASP